MNEKHLTHTINTHTDSKQSKYCSQETLIPMAVHASLDNQMCTIILDNSDENKQQYVKTLSK